MRRRALGIAIAASSLVLSSAVPGRAYMHPGATELAVPGSGGYYGVAMSADARYLAYTTDVDDPALGDVNRVQDVARYDRRTGTTAVASIGMGGASALPTPCVDVHMYQIGLGSVGPTISNDGRYVAFESCASNLVPGDTNLSSDVFVRDLVRGVTTRVSVGPKGRQTNLGSVTVHASISGNGRFALFRSDATTLVNGVQPPPGRGEIYRADLRRHRVRLVSVAPDGRTAGDGNSSGASMTPDGRLVVFDSASTNLVAGSTVVADASGGSGYDVFLRNMTTRKTTVLAPGQVSYGFVGGIISANGRYVAFESNNRSLVPNDQNNALYTQYPDIFVLDRHTGRMERVSVLSTGEENPNGGLDPTISPDGRYVAFNSSLEPETIPGHPNQHPIEQFVYDTRFFQLDRLDLRPNGRPHDPLSWTQCQASLGMDVTSLSRYVAFQSCDTDLVHGAKGATTFGTFVRDHGPPQGTSDVGRADLSVAGVPSFASTGFVAGRDANDDVTPALTGQGANLIGAAMAYRAESRDLFLRGELQDMPAAAGPPEGGLLYGFDLRVHGVGYEVRIQRMAGPSFDSAGGASFGLFRQEDGTWRQVASLRGGYGTTGKEVGVSVPVSALGLAGGGRLSGVRAFSAVGSFATGVLTTLDAVRL